MKNLRLRAAIWELNFTQKQVAEGTGIPPEHLSMSVNGKYLLSPDQRHKVAEFLGRSEGELFPVETHLDTVAHELGAGSCQ